MCEAGDEQYVAIDLSARPTAEGIAERIRDQIEQAEFIASVNAARVQGAARAGQFITAQALEGAQ